MPIPTGTPRARLTAERVVIIRRDYLAYVRGYGYFAKMFGVNWATVRDVIAYKTWRKVPMYSK